MEKSETAPERRLRLVLSALLAVATLATFWPVLQHEFIWFDDGPYVTRNPHVACGLTWASLCWAFTSGYAGNWHPLTWLSHMLDVQCFGLNAAGHHLTNLLLHTANAVLLLLMLARLTNAVWRSAFVAALFALHPLHVESVAWVAERKDVLSTLFFLLSIWAYTRYAQASVIFAATGPPEVPKADPSTPPQTPRSSRPTGSYALALLFFILGLMSKPMVVTLPFVLLLLDYWPLGRVEGKNQKLETKGLLIEKIPFFVLAAGASVVTFLVQRGGHNLSLVLPVSSRLANAVASYLKYLGKTIWPFNLAVFYPHPDTRYPISNQWSAWQILLGAFALVLVSFVVLHYRKHLPWLLTGWFCFVGTLVPVIGLVQAGGQAMADRYTYIPLIGIFICVAWGAGEFFSTSQSGRRGLAIAAALALAACAAIASRQMSYWHDTGTLFRHALDVNPENAPAHFKLGSLEGSNGNFNAALEHFRAAIRADPNYLSAYYSLGMTLEGVGKPAEAAEAYQAAVRIAPWWDAAHNRLGMALTTLGRLPEARQEFMAALALNPDSADAQFNLGAAFLQAGQPGQAIEHLSQAVRLSPGDPDALTGLGRALAAGGRVGEAIATYDQALKLKPEWPGALRGLAWIRATCPQSQFRNGTEAVRLAELANRSGDAKDPRFSATLDAAYAEAGRFPDAIRAAEKTRELAVAAGQSDLAQAAEARLALYRNDQPFREPPPVQESKSDGAKQ